MSCAVTEKRSQERSLGICEAPRWVLCRMHYVVMVSRWSVLQDRQGMFEIDRTRFAPTAEYDALKGSNPWFDYA